MDNNCIKALTANLHQFLRYHGRLKKLQERKATSNMARNARRECAKHVNGFAKQVIDGDNDFTQIVEPTFREVAEEYFNRVYHSEGRQDLPGTKMLLVHTIISTRALSCWMNWKPPSGTAGGNLPLARLTRYNTSCFRDALL